MVVSVNDRASAFIGTSRRRRLLENFLSLSMLQGVNYILPLITIPYLVRVLGPEKFGLIAFAQAFVQYFMYLTDYGFNLSATRKISIYREDLPKVSEIFNSVMIIKLVFMFISFVVLMSLLFTIPRFAMHRPVYLLAFGMVLGNAIFPLWLFQGMEKMRINTSLNLLAKAVFTFSIFVFVRSENDYLYVPLVNSLGFIVAGFLSLWITWNNFNIEFRVPALARIVSEMKDGWHVFITITASSVYTMAVPFILGLLTDYRIVGYYCAGEKIIRAFEGLLGPFSQAVYPYIGKMASRSRTDAIVFIRRLIKIVGPVTFFSSIAIILFAPKISSIVLGKQFAESVPVIRIMAPLFFAKGLGYVFLVQTMLNFGHDRTVFRVVLLSSVVSIASSFILMPFFSHEGAAVAALLPEVTTLLLSALFVERKYNVLGFARPVLRRREV